MYQKYREMLSESPATISCSNNKFTIQDVLKIDLQDYEKHIHLRIPQKNERPEDVTLASGFKSIVLLTFLCLFELIIMGKNIQIKN